MRIPSIHYSFVAVTVSCLLVAAARAGGPSGTAFTYQGQLRQGGVPVSAICDFEFRLFDVEKTGTPIAPVSDATLVDVTNGLFTAFVDFGGSVFDGDARWLEVAVRCPAGSGEYVLLEPRGGITAAPHALQTRGIFVDDQGQVGIGTTQPADALHIVQDQTSSAFSGVLVENVNPPAGQSAVYLDLKNNAPEAANTYRLQHVGNVPGREGNFEIWDVGDATSRIAITPTGNVGIGTATPNQKLSILDPQDATLSFALKLANPSDQLFPSTGVLFQVDSGGDRGKGAIAYRKTGTWNRGEFHFLQNSSADSGIAAMADSVLKITNTGDVGVGIGPSATPDARLEVADDQISVLTYPLKIANHGAGVGSAAGILFHAGHFSSSTGKGALVYERRLNGVRGDFHFLQNADEDLNVKPGLADAVMTIANNGNVGIGTDSPLAKLHVAGFLKVDGPIVTDHSVSIGFDSPVFPLQVLANDLIGILSENIADTGTAISGKASTTSDRFTPIGVKGEAVSPIGRGVVGLASATSGANFGVHGESRSADGCDFYAAGAGDDYCAASSRRWKSHVESISDPLDKLARLRGVYFDWDEEHGGHHDIGMIAEEVGMVLPEIVNYEENGIDASGMDYSKWAPLLVEAVNALRAEKDLQIEELQTRLAVLEESIGKMGSPSRVSTLGMATPTLAALCLIGILVMGRSRGRVST